MRAYAAPADYAATPWSGTATEGELQLASLVVDAALEGAVYATDGEGYPTDPAVRQALREATCAVLQASQPQGELAQLAGLKGATIGGVQYVLEAALQPASDPYAQPRLPAAARQLLRNAGLARGVVYVSG